ncbi:MAG: hypothetical protein Q9171_004360 [Xanthocarpia ochracea]
MRLLPFLASLLTIAFFTLNAAAYEDNCKGSGGDTPVKDCDAAIQSIDDNEVYDAPQKWDTGHCVLEYRCHGKPMGTAMGEGDGKHHPILGYSLRETAAIIKANCLDRWRNVNKVVGTYGTGNQEDCALTLNFRPNYVETLWGPISWRQLPPQIHGT